MATTSTRLTGAAVLLLTAGGLTLGTAVGAAAGPDRTASTKAAKIASATSAAPRSVSAHATVVDYPSTPTGPLPVLRAGNNGWTCMPDDPTTPGPDPICFDKQTRGWIDAWMAHKAPHLDADGYAYMLRGSSDASNTDPFATKPARGEHWMTSPPHVMVFPKDPASLDHYSADRSNGGPWVMFRGTPYAHLMWPVGPTARS